MQENSLMQFNLVKITIFQKNNQTFVVSKRLQERLQDYYKFSKEYFYKCPGTVNSYLKLCSLTRNQVHKQKRYSVF